MNMNVQTSASVLGGGAGGKSGINGEEGVCNRYNGVGFLISCPLKLLA